MPAAGDCIFCQIVARESPARVIFENEHTLAFLDINPATRGHTLVVPKAHIPDLLDLSEEAGHQVMSTAQRVLQTLDAALAPEGHSLFLANRPAGWQEVFHLHLHLLPRWADDGLKRPWRPTAADEADLEQVFVLLKGSPEV